MGLDRLIQLWINGLSDNVSVVSCATDDMKVEHNFTRGIEHECVKTFEA